MIRRIRVLEASLRKRALFGVCLVAVCLCTCSIIAQTRPKSAQKRTGSLQSLLKQHAELHEKFAAALDGIARFCDEKNLQMQGARIRQLAEPPRSAELRFAPLPREEQPQVPADAPADERFWRMQLRFQQQEY